MAEACSRCGGVGYGSIDPEFGWRRGSTKGEPPVPCPDCQGRFATYSKDAVATMVVDTKKIKTRPNELTFGQFVEPRTGKSLGVDVVGGGDPSELSDSEFDPGVVNLGSEKVSIDDAMAATAGEG
jgi:hypothetical protein